MHTMVRRCLVAGVSLTAFIAKSAAAKAQVRDSAGIRIIENPAPLGVVRTLSATPALVIGTGDGEAHQLSRVAGAGRLSDGRIVVADGGSSQLRFFDSTGRHLKSVGRSGAGPGEFQRLEVFARLKGDTLLAGGVTRGHSFFAPDGTFLRVARTVASGPPGPGPRVFMSALDDQSLLMTAIPMPGTPPAGAEQWAESVNMFIVSRDGAVRPIGALPYMMFARGENQPRPPWFGAVLAFATNGQEIFTGFPTEYSIRVLSPDGAVKRIIRRRWSPVKVTRADIDSYVEEWSRRWIKETGAEGERRKRELRASPFADVVPAFSEFIVDDGGNLWVREPHLADAPASGALNAMPLVPSTWSVFDTDGRWSGDVTMPRRFKPTQIGASYILGIARDDDGVETVVTYRYTTRR